MTQVADQDQQKAEAKETLKKLTFERDLAFVARISTGKHATPLDDRIFVTGSFRDIPPAASPVAVTLLAPITQEQEERLAKEPKPKTEKEKLQDELDEILKALNTLSPAILKGEYHPDKKEYEISIRHPEAQKYGASTAITTVSKELIKLGIHVEHPHKEAAIG